MEKQEFDPKNILKVDIGRVELNDYNPKIAGSEEYKKVVESLRVNGLRQPIMVREVGDKFVVVDGAQRLTAAKELNYKEVYVYDLGNISEADAKALTIWMEVQVPFDQIMLAPIVSELCECVDIVLPFSPEEIEQYKQQADFSLDDFEEEEPELDENAEMKTLKIKVTDEEFEIIQDSIKTVSERENVSEGRALELIVANAIAGEEE